MTGNAGTRGRVVVRETRARENWPLGLLPDDVGEGSRLYDVPPFRAGGRRWRSVLTEAHPGDRPGTVVTVVLAADGFRPAQLGPELRREEGSTARHRAAVRGLLAEWGYDARVTGRR